MNYDTRTIAYEADEKKKKKYIYIYIYIMS